MLFAISSKVQPQQVSASGAEILQALKKLNVLGSVLYIAAHPDDENNSVLTYMSKGKLVEIPVDAAVAILDRYNARQMQKLYNSSSIPVNRAGIFW